MSQALSALVHPEDHRPPRIHTPVDLDAPGKQTGYLSLPHSTNESAWGAIRVPVAVIANGTGPTILFTGGNHGDEYEGPIALMKLIRSLEAEQVQGRVIVLPAMNFPAVQAGTRLSPVDGENMNRIFPGDRDGSATRALADYVSTELVSRADAVVDIHAGGKTLNFVPSAVMHHLADEQLMRRTLAALRAFGAPYGMVLTELDAAGMLDTVVEEAGKIFISTELGGGGTVTTDSVAIADTGVWNLLKHFDVVHGEALSREARGLEPTRLLHVPDANSYVLAEEAGIYEVAADLGDRVRQGQCVGRIHFYETPWHKPAGVAAGRDGTIICRHHPGLVKPGDCLAVIGEDLNLDF